MQRLIGLILVAGGLLTACTKPRTLEINNQAAVSTEQAVRVAMLDFGPLPDETGIDSILGATIRAADWREAVALLKNDKVQVVVVRANCSTGSWTACERFIELFRTTFTQQFRTVAWIDVATSHGAIALLPIQEFYFAPGGQFGNCVTAWYGLDMSGPPKDPPLEQQLTTAKEASIAGRHPPEVVTAMQIQVPVSATRSKTGEVLWRNDRSGELVLNPSGEVLMLNAKLAEQWDFSRGTAANPQQLTKLMGLNKVEWCGQSASVFIHDQMRKCTDDVREFRRNFEKYQISVARASRSAGPDERSKHLSEAHRRLDSLCADAEELSACDAAVGLPYPLGAWLERQHDILRLLEKR